MATTRATLKNYFRQYATPTEAQFAELIDAFVHKDEDSLTQSKIDGLVQALGEKVTTNEVNTLVASKVSELVSDPNFAAAPTAHSHVAADVEGLSAFITRVTNFLDSADVSDTTINRWKEIETFLTGITDQETLAGLLLQLKNEITALIPAPAPTNYLEQVDCLSGTPCIHNKIVQLVPSTFMFEGLYQTGRFFIGELAKLDETDIAIHPGARYIHVTAYDIPGGINLPPVTSKYAHDLVDDSSFPWDTSDWEVLQGLLLPPFGIYQQYPNSSLPQNFDLQVVSYRDDQNNRCYGPQKKYIKVGTQIDNYWKGIVQIVTAVEDDRFCVNNDYWVSFASANVKPIDHFEIYRGCYIDCDIIIAYVDERIKYVFIGHEDLSVIHMLSWDGFITVKENTPEDYIYETATCWYPIPVSHIA